MFLGVFIKCKQKESWETLYIQYIHTFRVMDMDNLKNKKLELFYRFKFYHNYATYVTYNFISFGLKKA